MRINRLFTAKNPDNIFGCEFVNVKSEIKTHKGEVVFSHSNIEVPSTWSQISIDIMAQKYFRKSGIPLILKKVEEKGIPSWLQRRVADVEALEKLPKDKRYGGEQSVRQVFERIAGAWTYWGFKNNYFDKEEDAKIFFEEIQYILCNQIAAPNSPQWFNTGLHWAYGIDGGPQGHYYFDEEKNEITLSKTAYERPQPHACFIQSVEDDLVNENGIMNLFIKESRLFKYGSGTGTNFSKIRGKGEKLSGGGYSSGLMSFLKIGDVAAGAIKSGGTTRRAAKMVILDIDHPDIEEFINWKVKEEEKVVSLVSGSMIAQKSLQKLINAIKNHKGKEEDKFNIHKNPELKHAAFITKSLFVPEKFIHRTIALAQQGIYELDYKVLTTDWDSESYQTVSGQNSNNSIRVPNIFLHKLENNENWDLVNRVDGKINKSLPAKYLWDKISYSAWSCADPGVQFMDTINQWHTCPNDGPINASNPCSEYMFLDNTACNLASINLIHFREKNGSINTENLKYVITLLTLVLEISVTMAQFPSKDIAYLSYKFRTLGLGYANLGAYLMSIGVAYDSDEGRNISSAITALTTGTSYYVSSLIAKEKGAFLGYENNKKEMLNVINNHRIAVYGGVEDYKNLAIKPVALNENLCRDKNLVKEARLSWDLALESGKKYGYRNAQTTCIAPTGTIGLLMDCSTTGIEPDFSLVKYKSLAGGGYFKIINFTVPLALEFLGYNENQIKEIIAYATGFHTLKNAPFINHQTLKSKGFGDKELQIIEDSLSTIFHIDFAFNKYSLGEDFCKNTLKINEEKLNSPGFSLLKELGFTSQEIDEANMFITGSLTLEGAPHLDKKHLPIFDCANICGKKGTRYLSYESHIKMLAAAQTFISGAISKTINMPSIATINDCSQAYLLAWQLGVKATALYRDNSKLAQPLQSSLLDDDISTSSFFENLFIPNENKNTNSKQDDIVNMAKDFANKSFRERPKNKRAGYTQKAKVAGHKIYIHTGEYEDGRLAEIFLDMHKEGAAYRSMMNCFAIAVSMGLQYGVPLDKFVEAFTFTRFEPSGMVEGHNNIKMATSTIDYIFRDLAINYLGRYDLGHIDSNETFNKKVLIQDDENNDINSNIDLNNKNKININNKNKGFEGEVCSVCQNMTMIRNGTCLVCTTCGTTTGCS
jgi:ribonucleoside-diphosphate reductase alpha chain